MGMKYCNNCKQFVEPHKKFNWCAFIILMFVFGLGLVYLIYYLVKRGKCPMCNSRNWGVKPQETQQQVSPVIISQQTATSQFPSQMQPNAEGFKFCNQCGEKIGKNIQFCSSCGAKQ